MGKWINLGFKIAGVAVAASPAIRGVSEHRGDPQNIPNSILYYYTGYDAASGNMSFDQLGGGAAAIIGGLVLAKVGSFLGRRF